METISETCLKIHFLDITECLGDSEMLQFQKTQENKKKHIHQFDKICLLCLPRETLNTALLQYACNTMPQIGNISRDVNDCTQKKLCIVSLKIAKISMMPSEFI